MKKHLLFTALLSVIAAGNIQAQEESDYTLYDFSSTQWTDVDGYPNELLLGTFNKVSANGEYAVGYDDLMLMTTFMWKRSAPDEIELINTNPNYRIHCFDVTNDGMVVGCYESDDTEGVRPAYRSTGGEWTVLPVPEDYSVKSAQGAMGIDDAAAVTSDGKYIAGHLYLKVGERESPLGGTAEITNLLPALWTKNGDGYELTTVYRNLGKAGESYLWNGNGFELVDDSVNYNTFYVYNISNDGRTIVGVNTADCGGQNPAIIRDGKLMQIYNCDNPDTYTFNGGICNSIDAAGNIYGYFQDDNMYTTYFVLTADNKLEFVDDWLVCGTADGKRFAQQTYGLPYTLDCSDDGSVIVGGSIADIGFGMFNAPALLLADTPATGVDRIDAIRNTVSINYKGSVLCVNGEYNKAEVYNAQGAIIAQLGQGEAYNLGAQPAGAYIVKVTTANGVKTFKVAR